MNDLKICTRCVMDSTDPMIMFDSDGVCNHCHEYDKQIGSLSKLTSDDSYLRTLVETIKNEGKGSAYDCVIGLSGGVDSTYVALLVKELGLRPIAVHLDNGWNSELAVQNIENIVKALDIDLYTYVINWIEFRDLQLSFLKASTPDIEVPTDHAIFAILRKVAKKYGIRYIINGINVKTESHHASSWSQGHSDWKYIRDVQKKFGKEKLNTYPHGSFYTIFEDRISNNWINILNYVDYNKIRAKKVIEEKLGWRDYGGKHFESIYTRFYQGYILPVKFGYDKRKMHLSSLICSGELTREDAFRELEKPPYSEMLQLQDREYICKKLNISAAEFDGLMKLPPRSYFDYPSYYGRILKSSFYGHIVKFIKWLYRK
ncbi:N-acetyl sugar amidotransferase [Pararcticibacter amylolyticus]|uniref:N-acetyl sugar amidotransferase n=1 Tax=Pararcticibacter amylolyticus TaxID=2173175 RepID=A0A2U2PID9_9SPHI|nr:N-acetyl sugar amidotransferase [Pararcticibacter amylolyticus]PWG81032.1 N-acetyl sugar amidotransferase [Pararcticibacter amylolyticus]